MASRCGQITSRGGEKVGALGFTPSTPRAPSSFPGFLDQTAGRFKGSAAQVFGEIGLYGLQSGFPHLMRVHPLPIVRRDGKAELIHVRTYDARVLTFGCAFLARIMRTGSPCLLKFLPSRFPHHAFQMLSSELEALLENLRKFDRSVSFNIRALHAQFAWPSQREPPGPTNISAPLPQPLAEVRTCQ